MCFVEGVGTPTLPIAPCAFNMLVVPSLPLLDPAPFLPRYPQRAPAARPLNLPETDNYSCVDPLGCRPDSYCECIPEVCGSSSAFAARLCYDRSDVALPDEGADVICSDCVDCD